jgi:hypothetical protein
MTDFIIAYHSATMPESREEGQKQRADWMAWVEGLGEAVVNRGYGIMKSQAIDANGETGNRKLAGMMGFTIVTADNMDAVMEMARACPFLEMGIVEVAETMQM